MDREKKNAGLGGVLNNLWKRLWVILIFAAIGGAVMYIITTQYIEPKYYGNINKPDSVYYHLKMMVDIAKAFDNRPATFCFKSLLLGEITENKTDNETADTRTLCDIISSDWLSDAVFDSVRDREEFQKVLRGLCSAT